MFISNKNVKQLTMLHIKLGDLNVLIIGTNLDATI
jgi:hypothetical protein